eukprot:1149447-Pelagomonas_calceolata.AAC.6
MPDVQSSDADLLMLAAAWVKMRQALSASMQLGGLQPPGCLGPSSLSRFLNLPACPPASLTAAVSCCCPLLRLLAPPLCLHGQPGVALLVVLVGGAGGGGALGSAPGAPGRQAGHPLSHRITPFVLQNSDVSCLEKR